MPSLTRLSPSRIETSRRGTLNRRTTSDAARASVGETIAPRVNAAPHDIPAKAACATTRDDAGGRGDEPHREQRDRPQVRAEVAQAREERRRVEERRQDRDEHEIRRQLHLGQPRHEAEQEAADDEEHRDRHPAARRDDEHDGERREEREELKLCVRGELHRADLKGVRHRDAARCLTAGY